MKELSNEISLIPSEQQLKTDNNLTLEALTNFIKESIMLSLTGLVKMLNILIDIHLEPSMQVIEFVLALSSEKIGRLGEKSSTFILYGGI